MALEPKRHKTSEQRARVAEAVRAAKTRGLSVKQAACELGVARSSYYRYDKAPGLAKRRPRPVGELPTPVEREAACQMALSHPTTGYKRLTYLLQNEQAAGLRAHQVRDVLAAEGLLGPRAVAGPLSLKKPKSPERPNQVWHIDLMYLRVSRRWFYLVDILDGYSRYVVHWTLNPTMHAHTVTLTVQEALERWDLLGKAPAIVHDSGTQFLSKDWHDLVAAHGIPNIRTRVAHPESNGLIERLHRTHRAEALQDTEEWSLAQAEAEITAWVSVYNDARPHLALRGLPPDVYYLGDPEAALAQREHYVQEQAQARTYYWEQQQEAVTHRN